MNTRRMRTFVGAVDVLALAAAVLLPVGGLAERPGLFALLFGLGLVAGALRIRIPVLRSHCSAVEPFVFCALAVLGPMAACLVATAAVLGASLRGWAKLRGIQLAFNLGAVFLATAGCAWTFRALGGEAGRSLGALILPLAGAVAVYFLTNTALVTVIVALDQGRRATLGGWRASFLWTLPAYLGGLAMGVAMVALLETGLLWSLALAATACWLLVSFFRTRLRSEGVGNS